MNSHRASKLNSERPGSSARVYEYANSNYEPIERRSRESKIPKLPKRTYSLEGKKSTFMCKKAGTKSKPSTTSMIPRPEWKKQAKRTLPPHQQVSKENSCNKSEPIEPTEETHELPVKPTSPNTPLFQSRSKSIFNMETAINKELVSFKNSVLRIPEYWTDAGETVTGILKNAITIITKQYPAADVETFEKDIENILKATDSVKRQILTRTESIINKANQIYAEKHDMNGIMADEELKVLTKKITELKNEVYYRKNVFGDLLKYGSEMKELLELEKSLKQKAMQKEYALKETSLETLGRNEKETGKQNRPLERKKSKLGTETVILSSKKSEKHSLQSCGDTVRQIPKRSAEDKAERESKTSTEHKETQTVILLCDDLFSRERDLKELNKQMTELNQLCRDHISKFKNFNLQIKMRGICNKFQSSGNKDAYNDQKTEFMEKSNSLACYKQDLESAHKQKDVEFHNNERMLHQKRKLLNVRDELIGMLKTKCSMGEQRRY